MDFVIPERTDITDPATGKSRLLDKKCPTCVFRPGNPVYTRESAEKLADRACEDDTYVVCHSTYKDGQSPPHAICRGFWDRHRNDTAALRILQFFDRIIEVPFDHGPET
ncbi:hypothetical protein ACFWPH_28425 [Nocardia sp. NPDC058499]|uniref:hypothetical protein n=1 Tax=Nocardia sp. NPDC058499 TaxID=3346530 RepID=UPI003652A65B